MGLEAGWNCHICLRSEHPTDAPPQATELSSQGYASLISSLRDLCLQPSQTKGQDKELKRSPRVRCSSAPSIVVVHSATDPQRKSLTLEPRPSNDLQLQDDLRPPHDLRPQDDLRPPSEVAAPTVAVFSWEEEDGSEEPTCQLLHQSRAEAVLPMRHRRTSERSSSVSIHERPPRRRSSSLRSTSVSITDPQVRRAIHGDQAGSSTLTELVRERKHALMEERVKMQMNNDDADDDDDFVSYLQSRRSSSTSSLTPGLGNRVRMCSPFVTTFIINLLFPRSTCLPMELVLWAVLVQQCRIASHYIKVSALSFDGFRQYLKTFLFARH